MSHQRIICAVTNDLSQDQRMHRICASLTEWGYAVTLVGRSRKQSEKLAATSYECKRLPCYFEKGFLFYAEYNIRLWFYLLKSCRNLDLIYAVDSDTLAACGTIKWITGKTLIFDAHEYFTEVPELIDRPFVKRFWSWIEHLFVPKADICITVSNHLASIYSKQYTKTFVPIFNAPVYDKLYIPAEKRDEHKIIYQGMLNLGRGLEEAIKAFEFIPNAHLYIIGDGDIAHTLKTMAEQSNARERIHFMGWMDHDEIRHFTDDATLAINLLDGKSKSYYYSLANKFFDYIHAEIPSVNMNYPEYQYIIHEYEIGVLIDDLTEKSISTPIIQLLNDQEKLEKMRQSCRQAKKKYNWQNESVKLKNLLEGNQSQ
jgi:glycosyltransferase involved in cell wall biosynthesis